VIGPLFTILNVVRVGQIHMFYRATLEDTNFAPGTESLEVKLVDERDVPWEQIAFRTVARTLQLFFDDRRLGVQRLHEGDIA
jgi:hypothetical protein